MIKLGFLIAKASFELVLIFGAVYLGLVAAKKIFKKEIGQQLGW